MGKKGDRTKQIIKARALGLFARKGFKDVTMKDVCEATGLSRGGLYLHYGSTGEIFTEIVDDLMNAQRDEFGDKIARGMSAKEILLQVLERYKNEMADTQGSLSVAIYEFFGAGNAGRNNALLRQYRKSREMWRQLLEYGIRRGEFRPVAIDAAFDLIVFSYQGVRMYGALMDVDERTPGHIVSLIETLLLPGGKE
ncbi:MAG TPA: TetR/AcrR family transcriptional regulator [Firmicutes bacterium]|nr:TetR/AcrR family transcriptional regulator [Bacillota bacterium]